MPINPIITSNAVPFRKMHFLVILITAACFTVFCINKRRNHTTFDKPTTEFLSNLDESLSRCGPFQIDIRELTIPQFQDHFQSGRLTSQQLTKCYLNRISKIDVYLKSVIEINSEAISLASKADKERRAGSVHSLIHGIPILIKDNIGTADCMQTTAGAKALENLVPKRDADVVQRLRRAGAIILGKTNPSEWAKDDHIPSGWSGRGGQTISAYVLDESPSGSSTGSAVSISANLAVASLGTETDGSIISPSTRNALVGLKTTIGKVSTRGVIPLSFSNDVIGPMARTVIDAAILMGIISDIDLRGCDVNLKRCFLKENYKIGVLREPFWNASNSSLDAVIPALEACLEELRANKLVHVIDPVESRSPTPHIADETETITFAHEFKFSINNYLKNDVHHVDSTVKRKIFTLADIIKYNEMNPAIEGRMYGQSALKLSEATDGLHNVTYLNARTENRRKSIVFLESIFKKYGVDALATPCDSDDSVNLFMFGAFAGYPSITVPVGIAKNGMPFGLCLLGKFNSEPVLLKLGSFIEMARSAGRPVPHYLHEN